MLNYFVREQSRGKGEGVKIKQIPNLTSPQRISQLNFSFNDIRTIPAHITAVLNLQIIDLSHNKIIKIEHIYRLTSIKFVNLSHNLISEIPYQMTHMVEIQNIDLSFNRIAILNNIKVLKQLAEIRIFDYHGFLEVNLEGNQILKKKGCKEIYKKWMNPSQEEYKKKSRQDCRDGYIHLTKKRNSKSLEFPSKEHSMMTQRVNLHAQKLEETKFFDIKKKQDQKQNSHLKQSIQMTQKLSPNFVPSEERSNIKENPLIVKSEILNSFHNYKDLSKIYQSITIQDVNNLGEWFCICIDQLNDLNEKFQLITSNEDINSLAIEVRAKLSEESSMARQIILLCLRIVKEAIDNKLSKEVESKLLTEIALLDGKIKDHHLQILKNISENTQNLPIKVYKVWVSLYRRLKAILTMIPQKIDMHKFSYLREQQIQDLLSISPEKNKIIMPMPSQKKQETVKNQSSNKQSASKDKLNDLLFSNKSECLLLSENKDVRASSEKKMRRKGQNQKEDCENCMMLKWQNTKNKQQLVDLNEKVQVLQKERCENHQMIKNLQKFKEKYLVLADKQDLIIGELEYLKPSTYQNLMLEQAKAIEYMLKTSDLVDYKQINSMPKESKEEQLRQYTSKQMQKDKSMMLNTRLTSSKNAKENTNRNKVSEFSVQGKKDMVTKESSNANRGSSYFKNKNIITTINRTGQDPKTQIVGEYLASEESRPKNEVNHRQEVVVSQFNSHLNSAEKSSGKSKNITFQNFTTENNNSKEMPKNNRKITQKSSKIENDIILISEGSDMKNINLSKKQTLKSIASQNENRNQTFQYLKSQEFNTFLREKMTHDQKASRINKQISMSFKDATNKAKGKQSNHRQSKRINSDLSDKQNCKPEQLKRNKTSDRLYEDCYVQNTYVPMDSQEADNYKKYMKYHLRNNIIEILFKKGSGVIDTQNPQKYSHLTKNQKLINKPNTTHRSESEGGLSKRSQINRTFR